MAFGLLDKMAYEIDGYRNKVLNSKLFKEHGIDSKFVKFIEGE